MRRAVRDELLGHIYIAYTYTFGFGHEQAAIRQGEGELAAIDPSWYYRRGAGPVPDVTVYALQLATSVLGSVRRVTALANRGSRLRDWRGQPIEVEVEDNNLLALEFVSGTLAVAVGANCWGSVRNPWGGLGLYGTRGRLEVTDVEMSSGYPVAFELQSAHGSTPPSTYTTSLAAQPYLRGAHLQLEEPHIYVDIMDLVDAIRDRRPPRATGEQARHVVEIIERARIAAETGQTQVLITTFAPPDPVA
jgi:predicted dehydrogenase